MDFFPHPFFMAFLLSDLQPLYIRLAGRFSFIFKHLLGGTHCACVSSGARRRQRAGWVLMEVKVETRWAFFFNQSLMTISVLIADMAAWFLTEVRRLCCLSPSTPPPPPPPNALMNFWGDIVSLYICCSAAGWQICNVGFHKGIKSGPHMNCDCTR